MGHAATSLSGNQRSLRAALSDASPALTVSVVLFAVGVLTRLYFFADRRSLWLDEVWVSLNIVSRSFFGLARPLDYAQSAPVAFLWAEHLAVAIGGVNEFALRVFPLLTGCLLLAALWMLARRMIDSRSAVLCLALAVVSPLLIYYSNEVKPYISDALVTVLITWLTLDVLEAPDSTPAWRRLAIGGVLALLVSTPSVFVLAGAGVALVGNRTIHGSRAGWMRLLVTGGLWVLIFVAGYFAIYRATANSEYMQRIWKNAFLALPPRALITGVVDTARTLWNQALFDGEEALIPRKTITIMALLTIIGAVSVARRRGVPAALLLVIPFLVVGGASIARLWPMTPRLLVFLIPTVILLPVAGLSALSSRLPARARDAVFAVAVLLAMVPAGVVDVEKLRQPQRPDDSAPLIREFLAARKDGALMYVMGHAAPSWLFYTAPWDRRSGPVFQYAMARANTTAHPATRSCIQQERTQRTVFGGMGPVSFSDSSLAAEAAWVAAQPESEVWFLALAYETEPARRLDEQFVASGGTRTLDLARGGAQLRRYRFPPADSSGAKAHCEGEVAN